MDHSKVVEHMAMAEATRVPGEQKKTIVMNILIGSGIVKSEPEKVAADLAIDTITWAANNPGELKEMLIFFFFSTNSFYWCALHK